MLASNLLDALDKRRRSNGVTLALLTTGSLKGKENTNHVYIKEPFLEFPKLESTMLTFVDLCSSICKTWGLKTFKKGAEQRSRKTDDAVLDESQAEYTDDNLVICFSAGH